MRFFFICFINSIYTVMSLHSIRTCIKRSLVVLWPTIQNQPLFNIFVGYRGGESERFEYRPICRISASISNALLGHRLRFGAFQKSKYHSLGWTDFENSQRYCWWMLANFESGLLYEIYPFGLFFFNFATHQRLQKAL